MLMQIVPSDFLMFQNFKDQIACIPFTMQRNVTLLLAVMATGDKLYDIHFSKFHRNMPFLMKLVSSVTKVKILQQAILPTYIWYSSQTSILEGFQAFSVYFCDRMWSYTATVCQFHHKLSTYFVKHLYSTEHFEKHRFSWTLCANATANDGGSSKGRL